MKKILSVLFGVLFAAQAWAFEYTSNGVTLTYTVLSGTNVEVSGSTSLSGAITIPSTVTNSENNTTYTVTKIGDNAFKGCSSITSVSIPNTVTIIGDNAFRSCSALISITIPSSVTYIGDCAFYVCNKLRSIIVESSNTAYLSENGVLFNKAKTELICYPGGKTGVSTFAIPNSVTSITGYAFYGCSLSSISIPSSVISIGNGAFYGNDYLQEINVESANTVYTSENGILFNKAKTELICYPPAKTETTYTIPNSVTSLGDFAFYHCRKLTSVSIPNSVTSIGKYEFYDCNAVKYVTIPEFVTKVGKYAFSYCYGTKYCQATSRPSGWDSEWQTLGTVKWGCKVVDAKTNNDEYGTVSASGTNVAATGYNGSLWYLKETTDGTATLTAEPAEHYYFVKWSDESAENPHTVAVTESKTYTATFARKPIVTVNAEHGTVTGDGEYALGTTTTLTVTPNYGYVFAGWADIASVANPRTVTVNGNLNFTALFELDNFEITANASANGQVSGGGSYEYLSTATLTATPDYHYYFDHWNDSNTDNPRNVTVNDNAAYTATFTYGPMVTAVAENGMVEGAGMAYKPGTSVLLTAVPNAGYYFVGWNDNVTVNPRPVTAPSTDDATYTAIFAVGKTVTVNTEHGTIDGAGGHRPGSTVTLTAIPDEGYHFVSWGDGEQSATRVVTVDDDMVLSATFEINSYTVTATATNGNVTGGGTYTHGQTATLTATPQNNHYYFVEWSDGGTVNPLDTTITENVSLTATFALGAVVTIDAGYGIVNGAESGTYPLGETITFEAVSTEGCNFVKWSDDVTTASRTITLTADTTISAIFEYETYTITLGSSSHGRIKIKGTANADGTYNWGSTIKLTAEPSEGYHFVKWSDNKKGSSRTIDRLTGNLELSAVFEEHTVVTDKAVEPTCTRSGKTEGSHCEVCEAVIVEQTSIPALGHDFGEYVYNNDATTFADGTETATCKREGCDVTDTRVAEGTKLSATAVGESAAALNIYAHGNTIVIENAIDEIFVYNAMGVLVGRDAASGVSSITVNNTGVYIVKTGSVVKRVMVN